MTALTVVLMLALIVAGVFTYFIAEKEAEGSSTIWNLREEVSTLKDTLLNKEEALLEAHSRENRLKERVYKVERALGSIDKFLKRCNYKYDDIYEFAESADMFEADQEAQLGLQKAISVLTSNQQSATMVNTPSDEFEGQGEGE